MANQKITELSSLTLSGTSPEDLLIIVDVNADETGLPETKNIKVSELTNYFATSSTYQITALSQSLINLSSSLYYTSTQVSLLSASINTISSSLEYGLNNKLNNSLTGSYVAYGLPVLNVSGKIYSDFLPTSSVYVSSVFGRTGDISSQFGDYSAALISFSPVGNVSSNNVQSAISELDTEKLSMSGGTISGNLTINGIVTLNSGSVGYLYSSFSTGSKFSFNSGSVLNLSAVNIVADSASILNTTFGDKISAPSASIQEISASLIRFSDNSTQRTATPTIGVYKFPEAQSSPNSRDIHDGFVFINKRKEVVCIGDSAETRFGPLDAYSPGVVLPIPSGSLVEKIYCGFSSTFIIDSNGIPYALGGNNFGQLGISGSISNTFIPTRLIDSSSNYVSDVQKIAISGDQDSGDTTYILKTDGNLLSCGKNQYGQLGNTTLLDTGKNGCKVVFGPNNTLNNGSTSGVIFNPTSAVVDVIALGSYNGSSYPYTACLLTENGEVFCCGYGANGQVGDSVGSTTNFLWYQVLTAPSNLPLSNIISIFGAGTDSHLTIYALSDTGNLYGWGENTYGQLNSAVTSNRVAAELIATGVSKAWAFGKNPSLFVKKNDGFLYSCGNNSNGQLGLGNTTNTTSLTLINTGSFTSNIDVEDLYSGLHVNGAVQSVFILGREKNSPFRRILFASGYNDNYHLGIGDTTQRKTFTEIPFKRVEDIVDIMPMYHYTIGGCTWILLNDGSVYFSGFSRYNWGRNQFSGTSNDATVPFFSPCPHLL